MKPSPVVLLPACLKITGHASAHTVQTKYLDAVARAAGCAPLILPSLGAATDWDAVLGAAHGVMLTGSPSNVNPGHFGETVFNPDLPLDSARDATTLPLIRAALARGMPLFAICRGAQEVNVALGGSLHQALHTLPGMMDHREDSAAAHALQYGPAHRVNLRPGGKLAGMLNGAAEIVVNSLHGQGIARLADGLVAEAWADDGLIEAYAMVDSPGFTLALQWHPEWQVLDNPDSLAMFRAFGAACRAYQCGLPHVP